jgi:hypothetical protein
MIVTEFLPGGSLADVFSKYAAGTHLSGTHLCRV